MKINDFYDFKDDYKITISTIVTDSKEAINNSLFLPLWNKFDILIIANYQKIIQEAILNGACFIILPIDTDNTFFFKLSSLYPKIIFLRRKNNDCNTELSRLLYIMYPNLNTLLNIHDNNKIKLIGITGTDGKTSSCSFCKYVLDARFKTSYIGTNGIDYLNIHKENKYTTPLRTTLYSYLSTFIDDNIQYCIIETSSEGILNKRIEGLKFDYAVFTNLSHEHLNTHKNMTNYFNSKKELFYNLKENGIGIVNSDDYYSHEFHDIKHIISYGIYNKADYQAINIEFYNSHIDFDLFDRINNNIYTNLSINRFEKYNLYNVLPAIIIALNEGININIIKEQLKTLPVIKGRLELISRFAPYNIYIDFAHTPNGLKNVLQSLKLKAKGDVILVCGAAGEKDHSKRPLMGNIATSIADYVVFTSEDPKDENPYKILEELTSNINKNNYAIIVERKLAIKYAMEKAGVGDIVLITGKGREKTYKINNKIINYSDYECVLKLEQILFDISI